MDGRHLTALRSELERIRDTGQASTPDLAEQLLALGYITEHLHFTELLERQYYILTKLGKAVLAGEALV